ncbi:MAG: ABC transporter ATP-binding protein/permease [bacterium]|nr:ABC transporter ATP-binding protein/permease [bacterium]
MSEEITGKTFDWKLFKRLLPFAKPYWKSFLIAVICMLTGSFLELLGPIFTKKAIDEGLIQKQYSLLPLYVLSFLVTSILGYSLRYLESQISGVNGQKIIWDIRKKVFSHLQFQSLSFFDRNPVGKLMTRVTSDISALSELFGAGLVGLVGDILSLLGVLIILFTIDWKLALITLFIVPILVIVSLIFRKHMRDAFRKMRLMITKTNTYLQESITGIKVVKLFLREKRNRMEFQEISEQLKSAQLKTIFFFALFFPVVDILISIILAAALLTGGYQILYGSLTVGALVAFLQYAERFFRPVRDLSEKYNILQSAFAGAERVFSVLDEDTQIYISPTVIKNVDLKGKVNFEEVSFFYRSEVEVLKNVTFQVDAGTKVALVGATGAGKSTILSLLMRQYEVQKGRIEIDDIDISEYDPYWLRTQIAIVLQDVYLFSDTIANNISMGRKEFTRRDIEWAANEIGAHYFIERLPKGYETVLLERGANLSSGQKQLIALTRALITQPKLLLLDEATSAVDTETESFIQQGLKRVMENRTSIIVAHRLSTIQNVDKILVFHKGKLKEQGTHEMLLALKGIYYHLYQLQFEDAA